MIASTSRIDLMPGTGGEGGHVGDADIAGAAGLGLEFGNGVGLAHTVLTRLPAIGRRRGALREAALLRADDLQLDRVGEVEDLLGRHDLERARARERNFVNVGDPTRPRAHHDHAVGEEDRLLDRVGDQHDGGSGVEPDFLDQPVHLLAGEGVERAEWLVHQQHGWLVGQRPHQRGALLHAAGKLARKAAAEAFEADAVEQFVDPDPVRLGALDLERKVDVGVEVAPGQEVRLLEHHADLRVRAGHRLAVEQHLAGGEAMQPGHRPQERGLAAAGRADDRDDLAVHDVERAAVDGEQVARPGVVHLGGALHPELRLRGMPSRHRSLRCPLPTVERPSSLCRLSSL